MVYGKRHGKMNKNKRVIRIPKGQNDMLHIPPGTVKKGSNIRIMVKEVNPQGKVIIRPAVKVPDAIALKRLQDNRIPKRIIKRYGL